MASVIGTHVIGQAPGGPVVHVPPNGNSSYSDYAPIIDIYEMGYQGAQGVAFSGGVITSPTSLVVTGNGVTDDSAAINAAFAALAGTGRTLYFPSGTFLVTANAILTQGVAWQVGPGAVFTGTYANQLQTPSAQLAGFARFVFTAITTSTTYTGTGTNTLTMGSNATLPTQDGVTPAVGDIGILPPGTISSCAITAADTGPWIVSSLGASGAKVVLKRPSWYLTGDTMGVEQDIKVGTEGNQYGGGRWTSWAATVNGTTQIIGTADPKWLPDHTATLITLSSGFYTLTTIPIRSTTLTSFAFLSASYSGGSTTAKFTTGAIGSGGAATAAGGVGTGSVSITAIAVGGTVVSGDNSTGWLHIWNRP